ncbi:MAG: hypothetical protein ABI644_01240 [Arenimonas sp.]
MKRLTTLIASILLSSTALSAELDANPQYQAGGQYTAVLDSQNAQWQLLPSDGQDFAIQLKDNCHSMTKVPPGLWLLTRDADGNPELLAPSQTILPVGHSGHIPVVSCSDDQNNALALPASLIQWLGDNTGAVYVE